MLSSYLSSDNHLDGAGVLGRVDLTDPLIRAASNWLPPCLPSSSHEHAHHHDYSR